MMKRYGFTLVELMVVGLIFALISLAIFGVLSVGRQSWYTGSTQVQLQQETRKGMDWMVRELRESGSTNVSIGTGGNSITFQVPINDNPDWGAEGTIDLAIRYLLDTDNHKLLRRVLDAYPAGDLQEGTEDMILANNIRSDNPPPNALNFADPNGDLTVISIEVSAQKDAMPGGRMMQSTLNSQVTLRN